MEFEVCRGCGGGGEEGWGWEYGGHGIGWIGGCGSVFLCYPLLMFEDGKTFALSNNMVRAQVALGCKIDNLISLGKSCGCWN